MTLSLPPRYLPLPIESLRDAYQPDKRHGELFLSLVSLLALAWENKYVSTPKLRESELYNVANPDGSITKGYLDLSRRQYFTQKREMSLMGWLRSSHPMPGYVQFSFPRTVRQVAQNENPSAENRTELKRIEEEDSLKLIKNKESSSSSSEKEVRKIALEAENPKMNQLVEHLHLVFDPEIYSVLEWRDEFAVGIPDRVLGWIAKAYNDRERLVQGGGPLGLIVKHILEQDAPHAYFLENYTKVLPESFLEAVGEIEFECAYCTQRFSSRDLRTGHQQEAHPNPCEECHPTQFFQTAADRKAHFEELHDPYRVQEPAKMEIIPVPELDGSIEKTWQAVLGTLQQEMPKASFETWVRDSRAIRYDGNALTAFVRNAYARDWLTGRLTERVGQLLSTLLERPVTVAFTDREDE